MTIPKCATLNAIFTTSTLNPMYIQDHFACPYFLTFMNTYLIHRFTVDISWLYLLLKMLLYCQFKKYAKKDLIGKNDIEGGHLQLFCFILWRIFIFDFK